METGVVVSIALFLVGIVYAAGRLSVRVEKLEEWRSEHNKLHGDIIDGMHRLEMLIRGEEV